MAKRKEIPIELHGIILEPDGEFSEIQIDNSLQTLWRIVGGYVERLPLRGDADMFFNEDGARLTLPPNPTAQLLSKNHGKYPVNGTIVGTVLILGGVDSQGNSANVPDWVLEYLSS